MRYILPCAVLLSVVEVLAGDVPDTVWQQAKQVFGERVAKIATREFSTRVTSLCGTTKFYTITVRRDGPVKMDGPTQVRILASGNEGFSLLGARNVGTFLASLKRPVTDELGVHQRVMVFAELLGGRIRTHMPNKQSIIKQYMKQDRNNWPLVISGTDSGWRVSVTLMTDLAIECYNRYELDISRGGQVSVLSEKTVYTYTMYE